MNNNYGDARVDKFFVNILSQFWINFWFCYITFPGNLSQRIDHPSDRYRCILTLPQGLYWPRPLRRTSWTRKHGVLRSINTWANYVATGSRRTLTFFIGGRRSLNTHRMLGLCMRKGCSPLTSYIRIYERVRVTSTLGSWNWRGEGVVIGLLHVCV